MDAIKILSGRSEMVRRKIFSADLWHGPVRETAMPRPDPDCPCCGRRDFVYLNGRRAPVSLCGRNAVQLIPSVPGDIDFAQLSKSIAAFGAVQFNGWGQDFHIYCASDDMNRSWCPVDSRAGVRLVRQRSEAPCVMGQTWGYGARGVWVDRGCRADFDFHAWATKHAELPPPAERDQFGYCEGIIAVDRRELG